MRIHAKTETTYKISESEIKKKLGIRGPEHQGIVIKGAELSFDENYYQNGRGAHVYTITTVQFEHRRTK